MLRFLRLSALSVLLVGASLVSVSKAELFEITIEHAGETDFSLTPLWFAFHNGSFDVFNAGSASSTSLENLAEVGDVSGLMSDFSAATSTGFQGVLTAPAGFPGAPVIEPGETGSSGVVNFDSTVNRFLNFASMVIPSNDAFIGNDSAIEIFDSNGALLNAINGSRTLTILGSNVWDAGTEVNDGLGAAFSQNGGTGTDENGVVALLPAGGLDNFLGTLDARGATLARGIAPGTVVARITISAVPEPTAAALLLPLGYCISLRRRRKS